MTDIFKVIQTGLANEFAALASEGITAGDVSGFLDTGSYMLNAMLSGSLYGGAPDNRIGAIAGEESTGKTFFVLGICKHFLDENPDAIVVFFESESAISKKMLASRGVDTKRVLIVPVTTVQEFRFQSLKIVDNYRAMAEDERKPMLLVLDSFGMLSTSKEIEDTAAGAETKDMTRAAIAKATFRVLTLKLGSLGVPLLVTNHTYVQMGQMYASKEMGGGGGLKFAASNIIFLSRRKEKDGTDGIGHIITCTLKKGRLTKENSKVEVKLTYDKGLDRYYGLIDLAVKYDIWKGVSTQIELADGTKKFRKAIYKEPEKYFTKEVMEKLEKAAAKEFLYGSDINE